jgi:hypothetical protein
MYSEVSHCAIAGLGLRYLYLLRHDTGLGKPAGFQVQVVTGAGMGLGFLHPRETIPLPRGYRF